MRRRGHVNDASWGFEVSGTVRYTDKDGDVWEYDGSGYAHIVCHDGRDVPAGDGATLTLDQLIARYGPISLSPDRCAEIRTAALDKLRRQTMSDVLIGPGTIRVTDTDESGALVVSAAGKSYAVDVTVTEVDA